MQRFVFVWNERKFFIVCILENLDKTITTTPVYQDYKIGEEIVIKACERKDGIIELDIEKNNYDISNKETIIK